MISEIKTLNQANTSFESKDFKKALFLYSQLYTTFPENKEYEVYVLLSDLANEDVEKAMSLYDYFAVVKTELGLEKAVTTIKIS